MIYNTIYDHYYYYYYTPNLCDCSLLHRAMSLLWRSAVERSFI